MREPTIAQISAALRKTTETLAAELAAPTATEPRFTRFEWRIARAVAAMHGVSSLLFARLQWGGPDGWRRFLQEQRLQSAARHEKIKGLVDAIDAQARLFCVPVVVLKGAALHALGLYSRGERPMGDIDLLIRPEDTEATRRLLEVCGYTSSFRSRRHEVFKPRAAAAPSPATLGEHIDSPIKVEVHTRVSEALPFVETNITSCLMPRRVHAGVNAYPSSGALMMHLLLHAAGNMRARALRLIQLHDIALLATRFQKNEWEEMLAIRAETSGLWWAHAPLLLASRYYPAAIPPAFRTDSQKMCPKLLRRAARRHRLIDVSWSNIRIAAFPGLEWSRTLTEALDFAASRLRPNAAALAELKTANAQIVGSDSVPWYGIPHRARILRWMFSRPPRVQTMLCVRAALTQEY